MRVCKRCFAAGHDCQLTGSPIHACQKPSAEDFNVASADVQRCIVYRGHAAESNVQFLKILAQQITLSMQRHILKVISSCAPCG
jgi:hypothetical protein